MPETSSTSSNGGGAVLMVSTACAVVGGLLAVHRTHTRSMQDLTDTLCHRVLTQQETLLQKNMHPVLASQQQLTTLHQDVGWIKDRFMGQRTRGVIGELQLESVMEQSFSSFRYDFQYSLSNKKRVDCILHMPMGKLSIDCKFPLESLLEGDEQKIKESLRKHVKDIATKYILAGETVDYAILFLPSDAIFQTVVAHTDIVIFANSQKVYLSSPTTLLALLNQLNASARGMVLSENNEAMIGTVGKLTKDVERLVSRLEASETLLERTRKEFAKIQTSAGKIRKHQAELESLGCFRQEADGVAPLQFPKEAFIQDMESASVENEAANSNDQRTPIVNESSSSFHTHRANGEVHAVAK